MGCYTQFDCKVALRKDTPDDIVLLISHAIYDPLFFDDYVTLPDHRFFQTERWDLIFMRNNFHHDHGAKLLHTKSGYYELEIHCDINHGFEEVKYFIDWIKPHIAGRKKKQFIGSWTNDDINWTCNEYVER